MFRKIYKEANNSIHGDRAILDRAFEMAKKPAEKKSSILKYSFIGTAAAAVIVAGAVFVNYDLLKLTAGNTAVTEPTEGTETAEAVYADEETRDDTIIPTEAAAPNESRTVEEEKKSESAAAAVENRAEENTRRYEVVKEDAFVEEDAAEEAAFEAEEFEKFEEFTEPEYRTEATDGGVSASTYGGRSMLTGREEASDDSEGSTEIMVASGMGGNSGRSVITYTAQEYCDYIGIDFSTLSLPEGLAFDIKESYILGVNADGEIVEDAAVFSAVGDEREISVMTGRVEDVQWAIDMYEKVSDNMSVFDDGSTVTVYAIKDGTSVTAYFENIPDEEIKAFVEQIMMR